MPRRYLPKTDRKNGKHKLAGLPTKFRSGFLASLDNRTGLAKALRATYDAVVADVGGPAGLSRVKASLIERFCWLDATLQTIEHEMAAGTIDRAEALGRWIQAVNSLSGLAKVLGVHRTAVDGIVEQLYSRGPAPLVPAAKGNGHADGAADSGDR